MAFFQSLMAAPALHVLQRGGDDWTKVEEEPSEKVRFFSPAECPLRSGSSGRDP